MLVLNFTSCVSLNNVQVWQYKANVIIFAIVFMFYHVSHVMSCDFAYFSDIFAKIHRRVSRMCLTPVTSRRCIIISVACFVISSIRGREHGHFLALAALGPRPSWTPEVFTDQRLLWSLVGVLDQRSAFSFQPVWAPGQRERLGTDGKQLLSHQESMW